MSLENAILEHAAALKELAAAIRDNAGGVAAPAASTGKTTAEKPAASTKTTTTTTNTSDDAGETGPIYWANNKKGTFGEVADQAAYDALKKKDKDIVKITATKHAEKVKAVEEAEAAKNSGGGDDAPAASKEDLVKTAQAFLPKDLAGDEKEERKAFVKAMLDRFGGSKITEIPEENWGLVVNFIQRKLAGQDIDPADAEYEAVEEESLV